MGHNLLKLGRLFMPLVVASFFSSVIFCDRAKANPPRENPWDNQDTQDLRNAIRAHQEGDQSNPDYLTKLEELNKKYGDAKKKAMDDYKRTNSSDSTNTGGGNNTVGPGTGEAGDRTESGAGGDNGGTDRGATNPSADRGSNGGNGGTGGNGGMGGGNNPFGGMAIRRNEGRPETTAEQQRAMEAKLPPSQFAHGSVPKSDGDVTPQINTDSKSSESASAPNYAVTLPISRTDKSKVPLEEQSVAASGGGLIERVRTIAGSYNQSGDAVIGFRTLNEIDSEAAANKSEVISMTPSEERDASTQQRLNQFARARTNASTILETNNRTAKSPSGSVLEGILAKSRALTNLSRGSDTASRIEKLLSSNSRPIPNAPDIRPPNPGLGEKLLGLARGLMARLMGNRNVQPHRDLAGKLDSQRAIGARGITERLPKFVAASMAKLPTKEQIELLEAGFPIADAGVYGAALIGLALILRRKRRR